MVDQVSNAQDFQTQVITKAWQDEEFRQNLLHDPKGTVGEELGVELPAGLEIQVVEETPNRICLVLPMRPEAFGDAALSDDELEAVAGGVGAPMDLAGGTGTLTSLRGGFERLTLARDPIAKDTIMRGIGMIR